MCMYVCVVVETTTTTIVYGLEMLCVVRVVMLVKVMMVPPSCNDVEDSLHQRATASSSR